LLYEIALKEIKMENIVTVGKILSDINRVKILGLLLRDKELCVCEFCDTLNLSQPLVSRHLKQMKESGMITSKQEGKWVIYSLPDTQDQMVNCCLSEIKKAADDLPRIITCSR
jgi:ArsR family transcriptional regulator